MNFPYILGVTDSLDNLPCPVIYPGPVLNSIEHFTFYVGCHSAEFLIECRNLKLGISESILNDFEAATPRIFA